MKRKRSWHHLRNQDRIFDRAIKKLDESLQQQKEVENGAQVRTTDANRESE